MLRVSCRTAIAATAGTAIAALHLTSALTHRPAAPQEDAAVFRTQETLESGKKRIDETVGSLDDIGVRLCWFLSTARSIACLTMSAAACPPLCRAHMPLLHV